MTGRTPGNFFSGLPLSLQEELFETVVAAPGLRIERIVSTGQATPAGEWYDQQQAEWVLVLSGSAAVQLEGEGRPRILRPGDHLLLPARCRHRVDWTDPEQPTVWLAVHFGPPSLSSE